MPFLALGFSISENGTNVISNANGTISVNSLTTYGPKIDGVSITNLAGFFLWANMDSASSYTLSSSSAVTNWQTYGAALFSNDTNGPTLTTNASGGAALYFKGTNYLQWTNPDTLINTNGAFFIVFDNTGAGSSGAKYLLNGSTSVLLWSDVSAANYSFDIWYNSGAGVENTTNSLALKSVPTITEPAVRLGAFRFANGDANYQQSSQLTYNKATVSGIYAGPALSWSLSGKTTLGGRSGSLGSATYGFLGKVSEIIVFTNALPMGTYEAIARMLRQKYSIQDPPFVQMSGDQGFIGGGMGTSQKQFAPVFHQLDFSFQPHQSSIQASTITTIDAIMALATNYSGSLYANGNGYPSRPDLVYLLYFGTTCLQTNTASYLFPLMSNCIYSAKSQGFFAPAMTMLPIGGTNQTEWTAYNNLVRQYWPSYASTLIDFQTLPFTSFSDYTNGIYYNNDTPNGYTPSDSTSTIVSGFILKHLNLWCSSNLVTK